MKQKIVDFHKDSEGHWVADLDCGHKQHVRHDPPMTERPWVLTEDGRKSRLGVELDCLRCDEIGEVLCRQTIATCKEALIRAYEDAGLSGLCEEGRFEAALGALENLDLRDIYTRLTESDTV